MIWNANQARIERLEKESVPQLMQCIKVISEQLSKLAKTQDRLVWVLIGSAALGSPVGERAAELLVARLNGSRTPNPALTACSPSNLQSQVTQYANFP